MAKIKKGLFPLMLLAMLIIACGGGQRASLNVVISNYTDYCNVNAEGYKYDGFNCVPVVTINDDTLELENYYYSPTFFGYDNDISLITEGSQVTVKIDYVEGKGDATDSMPGTFQITSPNTTDVIHLGDDLDIEWDASAGADQYWVTLSWGYFYFDTSGAYGYFYDELDSITEGTSLTIPASTIFPSEVDSVIYGDGDVYIEAMSGPKMEPGARGNFKGDAVGFLWCSAVGPQTDFYFEQIPPQTHSIDIKKINKMHQEILLKFAEEN